MRKETKQLIKALHAQGFTTRTTANGHIQVRNPEGRVVATFAGTTSDHRALANRAADLRRAGFKG